MTPYEILFKIGVPDALIQRAVVKIHQELVLIKY